MFGHNCKKEYSKYVLHQSIQILIVVKKLNTQKNINFIIKH